MQSKLFWTVRITAILFFVLISGSMLIAAEAPEVVHDPVFKDGQLNPGGLLRAGGLIGYVIIALSIALVAAVIEHLITIRRDAIMPRGVAEELNKMISGGQLQQAELLCKQNPNYLTAVIQAGLKDSAFGYESMEKAMEDTAVEQSARLLRKIEYLSLIGALGPLLGLMGTVWGMIRAFAEFAEKANPSPADFAPAISEALVTTFFGLCVAVPALFAYTVFRNRIDEFSSEVALLCEYIAQPLRRSLRDRRKQQLPTPAPSAPSVHP
ncbi:MotA/TolQ/ExbB proton channel family protein [Planctomicrobium sp. SH668]|uniref:MotA/TolQ/ExbB proton channel family protein n=1 Tax=Planctomicrobium sp. SH668 TaxID=3448126 RepID=UPI003F5BD967